MILVSGSPSTGHEQHLRGVEFYLHFVPFLAQHRRSKQSSNETSNESNLIIIQNGANGRKCGDVRRCGGEPVAEEGSFVCAVAKFSYFACINTPHYLK